MQGSEQSTFQSNRSVHIIHSFITGFANLTEKLNWRVIRAYLVILGSLHVIWGRYTALAEDTIRFDLKIGKLYVWNDCLYQTGYP